MEYFLGSVITILVIVFTKIYLSKTVKTKIRPIRYSQTRALELSINIIQQAITPKETIETQSTVHYSKNTLKILFLGKFAYWIKDNSFYMADIINEEIDHDTTREVDIMTMDTVQLEKMIYIVEQLREGMPNDNRDSGQSKF
jgi:hypothetical protein